MRWSQTTTWLCFMTWVFSSKMSADKCARCLYKRLGDGCAGVAMRAAVLCITPESPSAVRILISALTVSSTAPLKNQSTSPANYTTVSLIKCFILLLSESGKLTFASLNTWLQTPAQQIVNVKLEIFQQYLSRLPLPLNKRRGTPLGDRLV